MLQCLPSSFLKVNFILYQFHHKFKKYFEGLSLGKSNEMYSFESKGSMKRHSKSNDLQKNKAKQTAKIITPPGVCGW